MKSSTKQFRQPAPSLGKIMMALALAAVLGAVSITPALSKGNDKHHDNGWHKGEQRSERSDYYYRERRDAAYYQPYYYSAPVYAPPPVYYAPQPSPGISLFFPLDVRW